MLEVICETVQDGITAAQAGADRIELVSALCDGGLTPSIALIEHVCDSVKIPVRVMLRPHARSFVYDGADMSVILKDLEYIQTTKAEGIVFGALTTEGQIDETLLEKVIKNKGHLKLTFHRAIDEVFNYEEAIDALCRYRVDAILTSGGQDTALEAIPIYQKYYQTLKQHHIECLAGKGISLDNLHQLIQETPIESVHMGGGLQTNGHVDAQKVAKALKILSNNVL